MTTIIPRRAGFVCHSCQKSLAIKSTPRTFTSLSTCISRRNLAPKLQSQRHPRLQSRFRNASITASQNASRPTKKPLIESTRQSEPQVAHDEEDHEDEDEEFEQGSSQVSTLNPAEVLVSLKKDVSRIISTNTVPSKHTIIQLLDLIYQFSNVIVFGINKGPNEVESKEGEDLADSVLRDLSEGKSDGPIFIADKEMSAPFRENAAGTAAELTWKLIRDPKVFISPDVLDMYTRIQCLLGKPEYIPEVFNLYAHKKIPTEKSSTIRYSKPWPKMPKYAVPHKIASAALEAAIIKKNLPLALAIIDTSVATPAFRANKILTRASIPLAGVAALPVIAFSASSYVAATQNTMDYEVSQLTAFAASMAYIGTMGTIAFCAITSTNDQMERVVWRPGTYLTSRWVREEEREFFDRLALAWGFQNRSRWGEEQGDDWQTLRDECGMRDMILDKTDLLDGMQ